MKALIVTLILMGAGVMWWFTPEARVWTNKQIALIDNKHMDFERRVTRNLSCDELKDKILSTSRTAMISYAMGAMWAGDKFVRQGWRQQYIADERGCLILL